MQTLSSHKTMQLIVGNYVDDALPIMCMLAYGLYSASNLKSGFF